MTGSRLFFDSNIWLGYFLQSGESLGKLVEHPDGKVFTSILSFHEVVKVLRQKDRSAAFIQEAVRFMRENSTVAGVTESVALDAVEWCRKNKLSTVDGLIYQTALLTDAALVTSDSDFEGLSNVYKVSI